MFLHKSSKILQDGIIHCLFPTHSTVRCFRWRLADNCGPEHSLKCSLRHRANLHQALATDTSRTQATLLSPGFNRPKNQAYYNRNLCIYNISLDCGTEEGEGEVELIPTQRTTSLSDAHTCRDYLSFHVESQVPPLLELCGAAVGDPRAYRTIPSSSFSAVLWTNDNDVDLGGFEIVAKCRAPAPAPAPDAAPPAKQGQGSGAGELTPASF